MEAQVLTEQKRASALLKLQEVEVAPRGLWELSSGLLPEQQVLFTTEILLLLFCFVLFLDRVVPL